MTRTITIIHAVVLLVATATSVHAQAPSNTVFATTQYNNHTYHLLDFARNHEEALQDVAEYAASNTELPNPYLLHLTTTMEKNAIEAWLAQIGASSISVWHGAEDSEFEATWTYEDGPASYERDKSLFGVNCPNGVCWSETGFWVSGSPAIPPNLEDCMVYDDSSSQFRDERCDSSGPTVFVVLENGQTCLDYQTDGNPNLCPAGYVEKPDFASIVCDTDAQLCSQTTCCVPDLSTPTPTPTSTPTATPTGTTTCTENALDGFNVTLPFGAAAGSSIGQTFTACGSGGVTSITINEGAASTAGAYSLWIAAEAGGTNLAYNAVAPYEVIADPGGAFPRFTTLTLATPFPVTSGTVYRFVLDKLEPPGTIDIRCTNLAAPADYLGGLAVDDFGSYADFDLDFEVNIAAASTPTATPTATPTPTPEPGVILQLVAGGVGLAFLNQRRMRKNRRPKPTI